MSEIYIDKEKGTFLGTVPSTNQEIQSTTYPVGSFLLSDEQTAGKGRGNHRWESLGSENIFFSAKLSVSHPISPIPLISLLVGGAVLETLHSVFPKRKQEILLKWPNDIFLEGKKIGGILIESFIQGEQIELILGIGINLYNSKKEQWEYHSLFTEKPDRDFKKNLVFSLIDSLNLWLNKWTSNNYNEGLNFITEFSYLMNKDVSTEIEGEIITGKAVGYTENGYLLIRAGQKMIELHDTINNFKILVGD